MRLHELKLAFAGPLKIGLRALSRNAGLFL